MNLADRVHCGYALKVAKQVIESPVPLEDLDLGIVQEAGFVAALLLRGGWAEASGEMPDSAGRRVIAIGGWAWGAVYRGYPEMAIVYGGVRVTAREALDWVKGHAAAPWAAIRQEAA